MASKQLGIAEKNDKTRMVTVATRPAWHPTERHLERLHPHPFDTVCLFIEMRQLRLPERI